MSRVSFKLGRTYTRQEIHEVVGGDLQSYLPRHQGRVVCGCFTQTKNPTVPDAVLVGIKPKVIESAELFASQSQAVPIFVKQEANAWKYVGNFVVDRYSKDSAEVSALARKADRPAVGILFLRKIGS